ncbi:MAG: hypothetical protein KTR20_09415 [Cellvibrionaceae bacterium]|nr:hypothetical protein [Cellvibrionaceae bacterium]
MTNLQQYPAHDDEIDLIKLIAHLWRERLTITLTVVITACLGFAYLFMSPTVYQANTQLTLPTTADMTPINNTDIISLTPEQAFSDFLNKLESKAHKSQFISNNKPLIASATGTPEDLIKQDNLLEKDIYSIAYPDTKKQKESIKPDIFTLSTTGIDRKAITTMLEETVSLATSSLIEEWKQEFLSLKNAEIKQTQRNFSLLEQALEERRNNKITKLTEETELSIKETQDRLKARKAFILSNRKDRIIELQEAIKIAEKLNLKTPSTLSALSQRQTGSGQIEVTTEIRNQNEPLYLRGTNLLNAELDNLKNLPSNIFLDTEVRALETKLLQLEENREIEILKTRTSDIAFDGGLQTLREKLNKLQVTHFPENYHITFLNHSANSPEKPIKPRKALVMALTLLIGGILGISIGMAKVIYRSYRHNGSANQ